MSERDVKEARRPIRISLLPGTLLILVSIPVLFALFGPSHTRPPGLLNRHKCGANLKSLCIYLAFYAQDHGDAYPTPERWCDLLVEMAEREADDPNEVETFHQVFRCPAGPEGRCHYALNPNADPCSAGDVVLLFESKPGWNQFGGAELLTLENHEGQGCNVLFADGSIRFVKAEEVGELKWGDEGAGSSGVGHGRRPGSDVELRYWLSNMIWYHRFTTSEVAAATGLSANEVRVAQDRLTIWLDDGPGHSADGPLLVLPYPGGRHPRIGFLEGAIDPQRETKFSVFTPWDANSYVVVDVPEAIWSNLGLTYLAHTHVDTIWTTQGIELPKLEWTRRDDGGLAIERRLPNGIAFGVTVEPGKDAVRMEMWLENGTDERLSGLRVQNCVMPKMAAGFAGQTNENKVLTDPYVACRSEDGRRWIITAWEGCERPWGNADCPCFHSDPKFPDLEPGERHVLRGWLSFYEGEDIAGEFARIEATGWRGVSSAR